MAKRKKKTADEEPIAAGDGGIDPSVVLHSPKCSSCGYVVPNDCAEGAGCPQCGTRLRAAAKKD